MYNIYIICHIFIVYTILYTIIYMILYVMQCYIYIIYHSVYYYRHISHVYFHSLLFIYFHSSVSGHLVCFHTLSILNNASINMEMHVSFWDTDFNSSGYIPRCGIAGSSVVSMASSFPAATPSVLTAPPSFLRLCPTAGLPRARPMGRSNVDRRPGSRCGASCFCLS